MSILNLDDEQLEKYEQWRDTILKDIKADKLGVREYFIIIPHTAGTAIKAVCGEHQIDLTNYKTFNNEI